MKNQFILIGIGSVVLAFVVTGVIAFILGGNKESEKTELNLDGIVAFDESSNTTILPNESQNTTQDIVIATEDEVETKNNIDLFVSSTDSFDDIPDGISAEERMKEIKEGGPRSYSAAGDVTIFIEDIIEPYKASVINFTGIEAIDYYIADEDLDLLFGEIERFILQKIDKDITECNIISGTAWTQYGYVFFALDFEAILEFEVSVGMDGRKIESITYSYVLDW